MDNFQGHRTYPPYFSTEEKEEEDLETYRDPTGRSLNSSEANVDEFSQQMMRQNTGNALSDDYRPYHNVTSSQGNTEGISFSSAPYADAPRHPHRWDTTAQDARSYQYQRTGHGRTYNGGYSGYGYQQMAQQPGFGQNYYRYQSGFSGHTGRPYLSNWNQVQPDVPNPGAFSQQYLPQPRRNHPHQTVPQHSGHASSLLNTQHTRTQEPGALGAAPEPSTQAQVAPTYSSFGRGSVHHGNQSIPPLYSSTTQPSGDYSLFQSKQHFIDIESPRPIHPTQAVTRWISDPTVYSTSGQLYPVPKKYVDPITLSFKEKKMPLTEEQERQKMEAMIEFVEEADRIISENNKPNKIAQMEDNMAGTDSTENTPLALVQRGTSPPTASTARITTTSAMNGLAEAGPSTGFPASLTPDLQPGWRGFCDYTSFDYRYFLNHDFIAKYGQPSDMVFDESATDKAAEDGLSRHEQRKDEAERLKRHRAAFFGHVQYACQRLTGALGTMHGPIPPLPNPMALIPGSGVPYTTPNPPVTQPLGLRNYPDLRSNLLEWGNRGGIVTLPLVRVTFFHASPRLETGPLQVLPDAEKGFRGIDIKTLFAEDGMLAAHAVQIPDKHAEPKEWIWFEFKQPLAEIQGKAPVEFQDKPEASVIMALPSQHAYFYSWHNAMYLNKSETLLERAVGPGYINHANGKHGGITYYVWSNEALPSMEFSKKPKFVSDLVQGSDQEFFGLPRIGPYPQVDDETSDSAKEQTLKWWSNLRDEMKRDAAVWVYMRDLMKNGMLGIELRADMSAIEEWERQRKLNAARQWTDSPNAGPLANFREFVGPKPKIYANNPSDLKTTSGQQGEAHGEPAN
ncbi:hypothetical protein F4809DRAFT_661172 [Biscogniauxia mediterranea]|nr:hypothetical protein F4809DRAFT_661172 [Biscogniauxia mediterranea]